MKLPDRERAYVPTSKLTDYLLSSTHSVGRSKAKFFLALGFGGDVGALEEGLLSIARSEEVKQVESSPHGVKYIIVGALQSPTGKSVRIQTVWIVDAGHPYPRFVTAYPDPEK